MSEFLRSNKKRIAVLGAAAGVFSVAGAVEAPAAIANSKYEVKAISANDGKERPNVSYVFKAGTKIFRSPRDGASVYDRVQDGTKLSLTPGPIKTDAQGTRFIGFSLRPNRVHDMASAAQQEMWVRTGDASRRTHDAGPATIRLDVHADGSITSPDAAHVNEGSFLTVNPPHGQEL